MSPPIKVDSNKVTRWHPKFLLDDVPEVEPADMPRPPEEQQELVTAKDVLNQARGKLPSKVRCMGREEWLWFRNISAGQGKPVAIIPARR